MSQYYPTAPVKCHNELNRTLYREEYGRVVDALYEVGFHRGWTQELESHSVFRPDFSIEKPFGE
jgi:putative pyruvate formate lyase activating enzyme